MGGLGVFAWLAVGAAAGWVVSRLMVAAADDALRGTAAGMIGGILGGLGLRLLDSSPALGPDALDASLAALAGSLWLTWITCVVTSGRQRGSNAPLARTVAADLEGDRDLTDARVVAHFDAGVNPSLGDRVQQRLAARMRAG